MTASGSRPLAGGLPELVANTSNLITVADFLSYGERHGIDYRFAGGINPACFHVGLMAAQGRPAVVHQADARPHHTSRSTHLRQCGAD
uniref:hypothetical protein n=1 Tax=Halomonas cupida TaxID=44933 RepID=UPI003A92637C